MVKVNSYSKAGAKTAQLSLDKEIFEAQINKSLIKQAYLSNSSNMRTNNAKTLTRGKVSGGGKKPWRQKGTGRARSGSIRNPIWRGGGITFGPTGEENYTKKMPQKMRKIAIKSALSEKAKDIKVIESIAISEYKTQKAINLLAKLDAQGRVLILSDKLDAKAVKSFANITDLEIISYSQISVFDLMNADTIIVEKMVLAKLKDWLRK